jgi:starch synthase
MRLLTVTHFYETHGGGIERVAGHLNRQLAALGHETFWAASDSDPLPGPGTAVPVPLRCGNAIERLSGLPMPIPGPDSLRRLRNAVRASDVVIVHDALYLTSVAALGCARAAGKPVLLIQHIASIPFRSAPLRAAMGLANLAVTRPMLRAADQVAFISETTAAHFERLPLKRPPIIAFNGVDTDIFRPGNPGEKRQSRLSLGLPADRAIALFVGRFVEKKGLSVLREVAALRPNVTFALAGHGPITPDAWRLANVCTFQGLSGERLASLYRASDAFILPSVGEGYPLVIQEALATNLPVLCGEESAKADRAATPLLTGLPVHFADLASTAGAFAAALDQMLDQRADDKRRVEFASSHYSWAATARRYDAVLRNLANLREG